MKNSKPHSLSSIIRGRVQAGLLSFAAITVLAGCSLNSTSVTDDDLVVDFLVQNDNGQATAVATFSARDPLGDSDVDLVAGESVFYERDGQDGELRESGDSEYSATLSSADAGWFSFNLVRQSEDRELIDRNVDENYVFLPNAFQSVQAEPLQFGSVISISWASDEEVQQSINGVKLDGSEDTFNAIATCQAEGEVVDISITEGSLVQQNGLSMLEIPVLQNLQQFTGLSTEALAVVSCDFDVQLVRTIIGITDISLDRRSTAVGRVLNNIAIQWMAQ